MELNMLAEANRAKSRELEAVPQPLHVAATRPANLRAVERDIDASSRPDSPGALSHPSCIPAVFAASAAGGAADRLAVQDNIETPPRSDRQTRQACAAV